MSEQKVTRYRMDMFCQDLTLVTKMFPDDNGPWVKFEDYSKLQKENARLREALEPFANDYFSNPDELRLNGGSPLISRDEESYSVCVYFEDVKRAKEALKEATP